MHSFIDPIYIYSYLFIFDIFHKAFINKYNIKLIQFLNIFHKILLYL